MTCSLKRQNLLNSQSSTHHKIRQLKTNLTQNQQDETKNRYAQQFTYSGREQGQRITLKKDPTKLWGEDCLRLMMLVSRSKRATMWSKNEKVKIN